MLFHIYILYINALSLLLWYITRGMNYCGYIYIDTYICLPCFEYHHVYICLNMILQRNLVIWCVHIPSHSPKIAWWIPWWHLIPRMASSLVFEGQASSISLTITIFNNNSLQSNPPNLYLWHYSYIPNTSRTFIFKQQQTKMYEHV